MIFRHRYVGRGMREDITVRNYGLEPAFCALELTVGADFADLFEVKEGRVEKVGHLATDVEGNRLSWSYRRGNFSRGAHLDFSQTPSLSHARTRASSSSCRPGADWSVCLQLTPVVDGQEVTPRYLCGRPVERSTPVARLESWLRSLPDDHVGARRVQRAARPLEQGPRRAAALRPRAPRPHRRGRGCAVVHDPLRPRQPAHVVDGDDGRLRPRARHAADAGALPGRRREPDHRGGARAHPARDALRRVGGAVARRRAHLLRERRRDAVVRHAARRARSAGATGARRSTRCCRPPTVRCSGSTSSAAGGGRRLRRVPARHSDTASQNQGWKDYVGHDPVPRRQPRTTPTRSARCRATCTRRSNHRGRTSPREAGDPSCSRARCQT